MDIKKKRGISALQLCLVAMAACINIVGAQIALVTRIPFYLDSIGSILTGALMGPVFGLLPSLLSGAILGMTVDIYSFYFSPDGILTGLMAGLIFARVRLQKFPYLRAAAAVSFPGALVASFICAAAFGGVTSSGSMLLVQLLERTPIGMTASVFVVQFVTDYCDRLASLVLVVCVVRALPESVREKWKGEKSRGCA